ncbi:MAG: DUF4105 domain-containing protein, partial [Bacteroidota bacterium]
PGDELYSVFGHSAVRVVDPENQLDMVFNYGTFDFDTPNFYLKFIRGKLLYKLSAYPTHYFILEYQREGRAIFEQAFNLTTNEKQEVYDFLLENAKPDNAYYHYDFFYDNCATRIRDLLDTIIMPSWPDYYVQSPEALDRVRTGFNHEFIYEPQFNKVRSFRDMLQPFLTNKPWSAFGIDLALGLPADKIATPSDFMFLPDEMLISFAFTGLPDGNPLVYQNQVMLEKSESLSPAGFFTPVKVFWALFIVSLLTIWFKKFRIYFDLTYFTLIAITGLLVIFLWFFTDHVATKTNLNILWTLPTHLYFIWAYYFSSERYAVKLYFKLVSALSFLIVVFWNFIPQDYNNAFIPLVIIITYRSFLLGFPEVLSRFTRQKTELNQNLVT